MSKANNRSRPTRQTASQHRYSDMKFAEPSTYNSVYDDQYYTAATAGPVARVDLAKLKVQALRKYTKVYEVQGVHPQSTKEDLATAVSRHWNSMPVTEESVLQNLMRLRGRY